jgi:lysophospholipase L1-like esterase
VETRGTGVVTMNGGREVKLVHMGDSITLGQYIDPSLRWTSVVGDRLEERYKREGIEIEVVNSGVAGETSRMGLERFPKAVQSLRPHVMTLQYGMNDCNCWETDFGLPRVSEAGFKANLIEMIQRARRVGTQQIVLSTNHRTLRFRRMQSGERYEDANARYSEIIRHVAQEADVFLCDVRTAFGQYTDEELEELLLSVPDHLHLSVEGNRIYADVIWPYVQAAVDATAEEIGKVK